MDDTIYQIGVAPNRIDMITSISGVEFEAAWKSKREATLGDFRVYVIGREELIANKRSAGRPKDIADAHWLETHSDR